MIKAKVPAQNKAARLRDYEATRRDFSWTKAEEYFTWSRTGRVNAAFEAVDRWAADEERRDHPALVFEKAGRISIFTYQDLKEKSSRLANLLVAHGFGRGDLLFIFLPPCPERYLAILACARLGAVCCPLYPNLNYHELEVRLENGRPQALLTHPLLAEVLPVESMSGVGQVFYTENPLPGLFRREAALPGNLEKMGAEHECVFVERHEPLYLLYTSGSTGPPKGVVHAHGDLVGPLVTGRWVLDLGPEDVLWTDGDPAWVTGTVYGVFTPWLIGATSVVQGDPYSASTWYRTLERHQVTVWYTTSSSLSGLAEAGDDLPGRYNLSALRHVATVGETLAPELFYWTRKNLGLSPHETWWMTETGMICLANFPSQPIKPGSMGRPVPGVEAAVLDEKGEPLPLLTLGELALRQGWPAMMSGIWRDQDRYEEYFRFEGWFVTGDMALMDEEGYFFHQGRNDDLIKVEEKLVGPFEVEHVLVRHPAVNEAAVISKTVEAKKPFIKAFVTLRRGFPPSARLKQEIKEFVKANMSSEIPLKEVTFLDELPKTLSGKLLRRVLRARELELPAGDVSKMKS
ncbi:MAG: AMP-binding protein [Thermodesulfobacteriota bacterium]